MPPALIEALVDKKVLIVEDEGVTQLQLKRALTRAGMKVLGVASDGETGLSLATSLQPDVVLMDVQMQGPIDGLEATRQIRREMNTCIIIMTAYNELGADALAAGASGYLVKPVSLDFLVGYVEGVVRRFYAA